MNESRRPGNLVRPQGWTDMQELAESFKDIYPTLFGTLYSPEQYTFSHSRVVRTTESCEAFTEALFGYKTMKDSQKYWLTKDKMLRVSLLKFSEIPTILTQINYFIHFAVF